ncbi:hypothetical protein BOX15_Mlig028650g1, partial [Macrostomum lignano]
TADMLVHTWHKSGSSLCSLPAALLLLALAIAQPALPIVAAAAKTPVILIPGDGGSQVEARLDGKPWVPHYWCSKTTKDYFPIWLNLELLTYFTIDCFVDNFRLHFDNVTNISHNAPNVSIRVPNYGDTAAVEYFDVSRISASAYFSGLVAALTKQLGYTRNVSVRGVPFDFRRSPPDLDVENFDSNLLQLIESTCRDNGNRPALLVAHSYGNIMALRFLQRQSADWKRRHIRALLAVGAPLGGAVKTVRVVSSGDSLNIPFEKPLTIRPLQRSFTSSAFLMPQAPLWPPGEPFASRPGRNYSSSNYAEFFADIGFPEGLAMRLASLTDFDATKPPGVEVHCVHGDGLPTPGRFVWTSDEPGWADSQPGIVNDNGDGTVNERSLQACVKFWSGVQKQPVRSFVIDGAEHVKILRHAAFINYTLTLLSTFDAEQPQPQPLFYSSKAKTLPDENAEDRWL